ncbi:MAG: hypothetical protein OHK0039_25460 [Bacteroidia bacterium]
MDLISPDRLIFHRLFMAEVRRRLLDESIPRIWKCLEHLDEADIWYRPNAHSNSVGNLVLHTAGNARQWILHALMGQPDTRRRQAEFDEQGPIPRSELFVLLDQLALDLDKALHQVSPDMLSLEFPVQGFTETGMAILIHVVEHASYHTGQITYFTKTHKNIDTGYYAGEDLDATG